MICLWLPYHCCFTQLKRNLDAVTKQAQAQANEYMRLVAENGKLNQQYDAPAAATVAVSAC